MVEVFKAIAADGSTCHFGERAGAKAWAGPRGRVEWVQLPEPPALGLVAGGGDPFAAVFNVLGIGSASRSVDVLLVNIENLQRRGACLSAVERDFFTVETPPDPDEDGDEPGTECLLRWSAEPAEYVQQFREALPGAAARGVAAVAPALPLAGVETLRNVIECLRADARYVDEEGEATDQLQDLLDALRAPGVEASASALPAKVHVSEAMARYLRRCRSGGLTKKESDLIGGAVEDAQRLGYFDAPSAGMGGTPK